jgi:hypothetical protein
MSQNKPTNISASVRQRLLNKARQSNRPFNELVQYYAIERFLSRLAQSKYSSSFILKGALLFTVWNISDSRATMDIDLLGRLRNNADYVGHVFQEICNIAIEEDGVVFDSASVIVDTIAEAAEYNGLRVHLSGLLDTIRLRIQIDIGFSDIVTPRPSIQDYPSLLEMDRPQLNCYSRESFIAEKYQAMVQLDMINSRMKDFYDIWFLSRTQSFNGSALADSIRETFRNRNTEITASPTVFSEVFKQDPTKQRQWNSFLKRARVVGVSEEFATIVLEVSAFLMPVSEGLIEHDGFNKTWYPDKGWN